MIRMTCSTTNCASTVEATPALPQHVIRREATSHGWHLGRSGQHTCPSCQHAAASARRSPP